MNDFYTIHQVTQGSRPRRETEREYFLRIARERQLETRRERRRKVLKRITRGRIR
jgi:hypothetical protein